MQYIFYRFLDMESTLNKQVWPLMTHQEVKSSVNKSVYPTISKNKWTQLHVVVIFNFAIYFYAFLILTAAMRHLSKKVYFYYTNIYVNGFLRWNISYSWFKTPCNKCKTLHSSVIICIDILVLTNQSRWIIEIWFTQF